MRQWTEADLKPFAELNSDPIVMKYYPSMPTFDETAHWIEAVSQRMEERGFGLWVLEEKTSGEFVGYTGLSIPRFESHFTPTVEVGWRLVSEHWGKGYATEAGRRSLQFGFEDAGLTEIVSFTVPANEPSRAVMRRLGMTHDPNDDFDNPSIDESTGMKRHVLYRMPIDLWSSLSPVAD